MCSSWIKHSLGCCFSDNRSASQGWVEQIRDARLGPTPGTEDAVNSSTLATAEKFAKCIQPLIYQEASMRNNRMTWFGTIQGFLWLSFAYLFTSADSCRNWFWIMQVILPIMGLIICLWVFRLINTADRAVKVLAKRWEIYKFNSGDPRTKYYERPVLGLDSQERSRAHCWMVIPFLLIAWDGLAFGSYSISRRLPLDCLFIQQHNINKLTFFKLNNGYDFVGICGCFRQ